jgi:hypothetical protein
MEMTLVGLRLAFDASQPLDVGEGRSVLLTSVPAITGNHRMFARFSDVISAINDLRERGLIQGYAIYGAVAQAFWDEAIPTFDLDVLVLMPGQIANLTPLYEWARERGYALEKEHIVISGVPVQFVPVPDSLAKEAVSTAATKEFNGSPIRIVRPEYLIALWLQPPANSASRKERAAKLLESGQVDGTLLADLMTRYNLTW